MKTVGLFEAKTKLSEICDRVATAGELYTVTRRGRPVAVIMPVKAKVKARSIWDLRDAEERRRGAWTEDFDLPSRQLAKDSYKNPIEK